MCKKETNLILDANSDSSDPRALKKAHNILLNHGYERPILLHFVLTGSQSAQAYRDTLDEFEEHFKVYGLPIEYFGYLEMAIAKGGLRAHLFFIVETVKKFPWNTVNVNDGEFLHKLATRRRINRIHISKPKNKIHRPTPWEPVFFARPAKDGNLDECMQWIADEYETRSKEGVPSQEIYFYSESRANTAKRGAKKPAPVAVPRSSEAAVTDSVKHASPSPLVGSRSRGAPSFLRVPRATSDAPPAHLSLKSGAATRT